MQILKSTYRRAFEVMLLSGKTVTLAPHSSVEVDDRDATSPHVKEHEAAGRLIITKPQPQKKEQPVPFSEGSGNKKGEK